MKLGVLLLVTTQIQKHLCDPFVTEQRYFQRTTTIKFAILFASQIPVSQLLALKHPFRSHSSKFPKSIPEQWLSS